VELVAGEVDCGEVVVGDLDRRLGGVLVELGIGS
jgi:hypothetical protein